MLTSSICSYIRDLAHRCKKLATDVLDSCAGLNEVRLLLKEEAGARKFFKYVETHKYPQLTLAVEHQHKEFVSHAYCQQVIEKDYLDNMNWKDRSLISKILYILYQIVLLVIPISVIRFLYPRIPLWFSMKHHSGGKTGKTFNELKEGTNLKLGLDIPLNRFIGHTLFYGIFLAILTGTAFTTTSTATEKISWDYWFIHLYSLGLMMQDLQFIFSTSWQMFCTFWSFYFFVLHALLNTAFVLKLGLILFGRSEDTENLELMVHTLYALATIIATMGLLFWFQLHEKMGPIIIHISHVMSDVAAWLLVWATVYLAFLIGLIFLIFGWRNKNSLSEHNWDIANQKDVWHKLATDMFWSLLNPGPLEPPGLSLDASINISANFPNFPNIPTVPGFPRPPIWPRPEMTQDFPLPGNITLPGNFTIPEDFWGLIDGADKKRYYIITYTLALFQFITIIMLLNLLIAAMNSTVHKLQTQNDMNWKFYRARIRITFFDEGTAIPVPLNLLFIFVYLFYTIYALVYFLYNGGKKNYHNGQFEGHMALTSDLIERRRKYSKMMAALIHRHLRILEIGKGCPRSLESAKSKHH